MRSQRHKDPSSISTSSPAQRAGSAASGTEAKRRDHFLRVMWFGPSDVPAGASKLPQIDPAARDYHPLPQSRLNPNAGYHLPDRRAGNPVTTESPAIMVMTDLSQVEPATIRGTASIDEANDAMIEHGVRTLFVIDDRQRVLGFVTSSDILGEKPMQIIQQRNLRHHEVTVRDIMIPVERLEVIDLGKVLKARVGDVIETMKHAARLHALVVDRSGGAKDDPQMVRGIFSLTQIARQLGLKLHISGVGQTFSEIESAIGP